MWHPLATRMWRVAIYLNTPPELLLDPMPAAPRVGLVDPHVLQPGELIVSTFQE
jgi:hypothetical protein